MKSTFILVLSIAVLFGCRQEPVRVIDQAQIENRDNVVYEVDASEPFTGTVIISYPSGHKKSEQNYVNGHEEGVGTTWFESGQKKSEQNYVNGSPDGVGTTWYESEQKKSEQIYVDGSPDGVRTGWYESGQKAFERYYVNGHGEGVWTTWYENGQKKFEKNYVNGREEGVSTTWHENGQKKSENNFVNGRSSFGGTSWYDNGIKKDETQDSVHTKWDENGQKRYEANYVKGVWSGWYENGQQEWERPIVNGQLLFGGTEWYDNGNRKSERKDAVQTEWYENGNKKFEHKDAVRTKWYENGELKEKIVSLGRGNISTFTEWDLEGTKTEDCRGNSGKIHDGACDEAMVEAILARKALVTNLTDVIRPMPHFTNGLMAGARVYPGRDRRKFASLGLRPGDLITEIDGSPLTDPDTMLTTLLDRLDDKDQVSVTVMRAGSSEVLVLDTSMLNLKEDE